MKKKYNISRADFFEDPRRATQILETNGHSYSFIFDEYLTGKGTVARFQSCREHHCPVLHNDMIILTSSFFHPLYGNCAVYNETISKHLLRFHDSYIFLEFYFEMPSFFTTFFRALAKVNFTLQAENVDLHKDMLAWLKSFAGVKKMEEVKEQQRQNTNTGTSLDEKYYLLNSFRSPPIYP